LPYAPFVGKFLILFLIMSKILHNRCPRLRSLNLRNCYQLSPTTVLAIAQSCPQLTQLTLSGCIQVDDRTLHAIAANISSLKELHISGCYLVTNQGSIFFSHRKLIWLLGISSIASGCKELESVNIDYCHYVSDRGIILLAENCPNIKKFSACNCFDITDVGLSKLVSR
jgi:F-box/leucine-rich repeat protein 2/20